MSLQCLLLPIVCSLLDFIILIMATQYFFHNAHAKSTQIHSITYLRATLQLFPVCMSCGLGCSYIGPRIDTTQQTNVFLGIHCQTGVATFNLTCLSTLRATKGLIVLILLTVSDK
jgi:hypothetical protein